MSKASGWSAAGWRGAWAAVHRPQSVVPAMRDASFTGTRLICKKRRCQVSLKEAGRRGEWKSGVGGSVGEGHDEEVTDDAFGLEGVGEGLIEVDAVMVAAALAAAGEGPDLLEVGDDILDGAFGDADMGGAIAEAHIGIFMKEHEDMGMVGEERPCGDGGGGIGYLHGNHLASGRRIRQPKLTKQNSLITERWLGLEELGSVLAKFGGGEEAELEGAVGGTGEDDGDDGYPVADGGEEGGGVFLDEETAEFGGAGSEVEVEGRRGLVGGETVEVLEIIEEEQVEGELIGKLLIEEAQDAGEGEVEDTGRIDGGLLERLGHDVLRGGWWEEGCAAGLREVLTKRRADGKGVRQAV